MSGNWIWLQGTLPNGKTYAYVSTGDEEEEIETDYGVTTVPVVKNPVWSEYAPIDPFDPRILALFEFEEIGGDSGDHILDATGRAWTDMNGNELGAASQVDPCFGYGHGACTLSTSFARTMDLDGFNLGTEDFCFETRIKAAEGDWSFLIMIGCIAQRAQIGISAYNDDKEDYRCFVARPESTLYSGNITSNMPNPADNLYHHFVASRVDGTVYFAIDGNVIAAINWAWDIQDVWAVYAPGHVGYSTN
jgi:hypothetical protein